MALITLGDGDYEQPDVINDPGRLNPNYDAGQPSYGVTDPSARSGDPFTSQLTDLYARYGRGAPSQGEIDSNRGNPGGLSGIEAILKQDNARAAAAQPQAPAGGGGGGTQWILDALDAAQSTDDRNYWVNKWNSGELGTDRNWVIDAINRGDGALAVRNGTMAKRGAGSSSGAQMPSGPNPGGYTDASSQLYLNQLLQRLQQLNTPQAPDPFQEMLKSLALSRVNALQQRPYTQGEDAAMVAHYRDPATLARDTQKRQASEDLGRRNIGPTSGLYQREMASRDNAYTSAIAQGDNALAVQAVQENQRRQDQALAILNSLVGMNRTDTDRQNALRDQAVTVAQGFPNFDNQRLSQLLQASGQGDSASSVIGNLTGLGNLNLNASSINNAQSQANSQAWAKILSTILGSL